MSPQASPVAARPTVCGGAGTATLDAIEAGRDSERAVADRFAAGDEDALRAAYDLWGGLVYGFCRKALASDADAEDVVQQTFVTAWRKRHAFDPTRGALPSWLLGIARHRVLDRHRANARTPDPMPSTPEEAGGDAGIEQLAERLLISDALARLPDQQRTVLELVFFGHYTHSEAASHLGLPVGTVKSQIRRGLERLRRQVMTFEEAGP